MWFRIVPTKNNYFKVGKPKEIIKFPLIWAGKKEPVWRFILIFSIMCIVPIIVLAVVNKFTLSLIITGLLFTITNATLEEVLWRGFILPRSIAFTNEKMALIICSLAFGFYHISLGFPIWSCLVFAIGGFFMGGSAMVSKGLVAPWIMHMMVNLIFVFAGMIV